MTRKFLCIFVLIAGLAFGQSPVNPVNTQQITMPVNTLVPAPALAASIQRTGNPGNRTIFYWVVAKFPVGNAQVAGPFVVTNAANTLSGALFQTIRPILPAGATAYDLLKTSVNIAPSGACACAVTGGTGIAPTTAVNDTSNSTGAYTVATFNLASLNLTLANEVQGAGSSHLILRQNGVQVVDLSAAITSVAFPLRGPADSAAAPNYSFSAATNSGLFRPGSGLLGFSIGGAEKFRFSAFSAQVGDANGAWCAGATLGTPIVCMWGNGGGHYAFGTAVGLTNGAINLSSVSGEGTGLVSGFVRVEGDKLGTSQNCASATGACGAASSGSMSIAAGATTRVIATTAVGATSVILVTFDEGLGTKLGITCNSAAASEAATYFVSARSAGTSFTVKTNVAPTTNAACLNYAVLND